MKRINTVICLLTLASLIGVRVHAGDEEPEKLKGNDGKQEKIEPSTLRVQVNQLMEPGQSAELIQRHFDELIDESKALRRSGQPDGARVILSELLQRLPRVPQKETMADVCLKMLAILAEQRADYDEAKRLYQKALNYELRLGNKSQTAITMDALAGVCQRLGQSAECEKWRSRSAAINSGTKIPEGVYPKLYPELIHDRDRRGR